MHLGQIRASSGEGPVQVHTAGLVWAGLVWSGLGWAEMCSPEPETGAVLGSGFPQQPKAMMKHVCDS